MVDALRIETLAEALVTAGFDRVAATGVSVEEHRVDLDRWLDAGYAGSMKWLERHRDVRVDPSRRFEWARSVLVVTRRYPKSASEQGLGPYVSTYAQGADYHEVLVDRMREVAEQLRAHHPDLRTHCYVDTGPALERQLAEAAGLGWRAKNSLLLDARHGSRFFLGLMLTDLEIQDERAPNSTAPVASCGSCQSCQSACPTDAFVSPGVVDARRCISYLTIEHRGSIDEKLRPAMGQWLFGCDLCQNCCPFEHAAADRPDEAFLPSAPVTTTTLEELLGMDEEGFRARFRGTPLARPKREGLLRNALIVVANGEHHHCRDAARALLDDPSEVLRETAAWCLDRLDRARRSGPVDTAPDRA